jgi:tetratricopeptide (TPR) repeat protein
MALIAEYDYASAKDVLEDLLLDDPHNPDVLYNLALCFSEINEPEKAIKPLTQCLAYTPDRTNTYVALGFAHDRWNMLI